MSLLFEGYTITYKNSNDENKKIYFDCNYKGGLENFIDENISKGEWKSLIKVQHGSRPYIVKIGRFYFKLLS